MFEKIRHSTSFVIPALNEENVVEEVVRAVWGTVSHHLETFEIILIDDGSRDQTGQIMDRLASELPHMRVIHNPILHRVPCVRSAGRKRVDGANARR